MSGRGSVRSGKCPAGEVSGRGSVQSGNFPGTYVYMYRYIYMNTCIHVYMYGYVYVYIYILSETILRSRQSSDNRRSTACKELFPQSDVYQVVSD